MKITDVSKLKGPLTELNNQLFGENGEERLAELNLWLKRVTPEVKKFPIRKTVRIGVHKTLPVLTQMLSQFRVSDWALNILGKPAFTLVQTEEEVELGLATVKELTGKDQATIKEIFDVIRRVGELCPAEVGPALREQYQDQPIGEWTLVAMEPIKDSGGSLYLFDVGRGGDGLWLSADWANPASVYYGDRRFVFRLRK